MPTVIVGSALDVVEHVGVARLLFTDFPLGNPCGPPGQRGVQKAIVRQALGLLESAEQPRTTVRAPVAWPEAGALWRPRYGRVDPAERERLLTLGEDRRRRWAARARPSGTA